jgi:hypothetical protein
MKIEKSQIFIAVGGILVGALAYKYFYSAKTPVVTQKGAAASTPVSEISDNSESDANANFLGLGKKTSKKISRKQKIEMAYAEMVKSGVSPARATKKIAQRIMGSKIAPTEKQVALAELNDIASMIPSEAVGV